MWNQRLQINERKMKTSSIEFLPAKMWTPNLRKLSIQHLLYTFHQISFFLISGKKEKKYFFKIVAEMSGPVKK